MVIKSKEELDILLESCKVSPFSNEREGGLFYSVKAQDFLFPDGTLQTREYLNKKRSSMVVPLTNDNNLVFVIQPIALFEEGSLIEFPAGYWELGENGMSAGIRELAEETGYVPNEVIYLGSHYQDPGSIKQKVNVYLALGCKKLKEQNLDKGEYVKFVEVPYELALELMDLNYLSDANSYIALSKADRIIQRKYQINNKL